LEEKTAKNWYHPGGIPTEPFFVPRPEAVAEDDGKLTQPANLLLSFKTKLKIFGLFL
jgi:carotenoid cleavage dioxygenase-like enzyme